MYIRRFKDVCRVDCVKEEIPFIQHLYIQMIFLHFGLKIKATD